MDKWKKEKFLGFKSGCYSRMLKICWVERQKKELCRAGEDRSFLNHLQRIQLTGWTLET